MLLCLLVLLVFNSFAYELRMYAYSLQGPPAARPAAAEGPGGDELEWGHTQRPDKAQHTKQKPPIFNKSTSTSGPDKSPTDKTQPKNIRQGPKIFSKSTN